MKKLILSGLVVLLLIPLLVGCGKETTTTPPPTTEKTVTIIDYRGKYVEVLCPVERIVALCPTAQETICAFGDGDKIVGHCSLYKFPSYMEEKPVVADNPGKPNLEILLEQKPDVVIADTHILHQPELIEKIENAGVPVVVERPHPENMVAIIKNIGLMLDKKEKAEEIADYVESYLSLVKERVGKLKPEEKPLVYWEASWGKYKAPTGESPTGYKIIAAGGINIAAGELGSWPQISPEWVIERNPDVIIAMIPSKQERTVENMKAKRDEVMSRPELKEVKAVKEGRVYIITWDVLCRLRYPVGLLYLSKWFYPDLFQDLDPAAVHRELIEKLYGEEEWQKLAESSFAYPELK